MAAVRRFQVLPLLQIKITAILQRTLDSQSDVKMRIEKCFSTVIGSSVFSGVGKGTCKARSVARAGLESGST